MSAIAKLPITGIVLSGGKSRRMGKEKGLCEFRGKPLISYSIEVLDSLCETVIVSANNQLEKYEKLGFQVISDEYQEVGPLGGLYSCLKQSKTEINLVLSCDTPFVTKALFVELLPYAHSFDAVIPRHPNGFLEPLTALYHRSALLQMEQQLAAGRYKMIDLLERINTKYVAIGSGNPGLNISVFHNLNSPEDLLSC